MTIIVQCECGRTLRAPDQMSGRSAHCVCGNSVPLIKETGPRQFDFLEADLGDVEDDADEAPLLPRRSEKKSPKNSSLFRPSQGQNVERGEEEYAPIAKPKKNKKRRSDPTSSTERKRQRNETFLQGLGRSLKFPFRIESILTIGVMALAYGVFTALSKFLPYGLFGILAVANVLLGTLLILGYFAYFLLQIFRLASVDEDDLPLALEFDMDMIRQDLWLWLGTLWWCGMPLIGCWWGMGRLVRAELLHGSTLWSPWVWVPSLGFSLFLFPMALMSTALHLSVLDANPWLVLRSIARVPLDYLAISSVFGVLFVIVVVIGVVLPPIPAAIPVLSHVVIWVLLFYVLTAGAYGFGNFYYRNRRKIDWFGELPRQI